MILRFYKYQGTGNDFVLLDQREDIFELSQAQISYICDRRFGIGADGLMYLRKHETYDFEMIYFNSDGRESSMCGNGGRAIARFAEDLKIAENNLIFLAIDGPHEAWLKTDIIELKMSDVSNICLKQNDYILDTGSPHYIIFSTNIQEMDLNKIAHDIRYNKTYMPDGINVNLVEELSEGKLSIRTYERGVEAETLSCGTGVTAAALSYSLKKSWFKIVDVETKGGLLSVKFNRKEHGFNDIRLNGPASFVFNGEIQI